MTSAMEKREQSKGVWTGRYRMQLKYSGQSRSQWEIMTNKLFRGAAPFCSCHGSTVISTATIKLSPSSQCQGNNKVPEGCSRLELCCSRNCLK